MKPLLVSSGEPAGIGPDLCLALAAFSLPVVILGDKDMLEERANQLGLRLVIEDYHKDKALNSTPNHLTVLSTPIKEPVVAGNLDPRNAPYVHQLLTVAVDRCLQNEFSALVTAPVHKAVMNQAGYDFSGHTEFLAERCHVKTVVMLLTCPKLKVALVTTHLPLKEVPAAITEELLTDVLTCAHTSMQRDFGISQPMIYLAGLNPHAGEGGFLGREEIDIVIPTLAKLKSKGINVHGPVSADSMFTDNYINSADLFVAMYHDQGLPVLKYAGFGQAVNVTLGLPIVRTSVDHGTALELAGTGMADVGSLLAAVEMAHTIVKQRMSNNDKN